MTERENALLAMAHKEPEWVPSVFDCTYNCRDVINTRPIFNSGYDCYGAYWVSSGPETNYITNVDSTKPRVITDITKWREQVSFPVVSSFDWDEAAAEIEESTRREKLILYTMGIGVFERVHALMDFEDALCALMVEPETMYDLCSAIADKQVELVHHLAKYIRPDVICYHDDWAMQTGPFMPPATWREILKPATQKIYDAILSHGINLVHHSCGKIESYLPEMMEMGINGWNSCQDCNDLAGIKCELGGKLALWGALDDQRVLGQAGATDEDLMNEARKKVEMLAPGGGWLSGPNAYVSFNFDHDQRIAKMIRDYSVEFYGKRCSE